MLRTTYYSALNGWTLIVDLHLPYIIHNFFEVRWNLKVFKLQVAHHSHTHKVRKILVICLPSHWASVLMHNFHESLTTMVRCSCSWEQNQCIYDHRTRKQTWTAYKQDWPMWTTPDAVTFAFSDYLRKIIVQGRSSKSTKVGDIMTEEVPWM
jgi:hypothetical protein